jgi:hypothetical protein
MGSVSLNGDSRVKALEGSITNGSGIETATLLLAQFMFYQKLLETL